MSRTRRTPIMIDGMPPGWTVEHVEYRGYDSPDRELQATHPLYGRVRNGVGRHYTAADCAQLSGFAWKRHPQITTIFLDVDEVLANWLDACFMALGYMPDVVHAEWAMHDPRPWDVFAVLGVDERVAWSHIHDCGAAFWAELDLYPWAHELLALCNSHAPTVLLTSPSKHPSSYAGKAEWIVKTLGDVPHLIGRCKDRCAHAGALLIDDSPKNCEAFRKAGGHAILFPGHGNDLHHVAPDKRVVYVREQLKGYRTCNPS